MGNSLHIASPLAARRPKGAHRFEVFSPKRARRLTFFRRAVVDEWLQLEADPSVTSFCERPGYVRFDGQRRLADFWVEFIEHNKLVVLCEVCEGEGDTRPGRDIDEAALPVRRVTSADHSAASMWIDNWQRMLPYVTASQGIIRASLSSEVERFVSSPQPLLAIERRFSKGDPASCGGVLAAARGAGTGA